MAGDPSSAVAAETAYLERMLLTPKFKSVDVAVLEVTVPGYARRTPSISPAICRESWRKDACCRFEAYVERGSDSTGAKALPQGGVRRRTRIPSIGGGPEVERLAIVTASPSSSICVSGQITGRIDIGREPTRCRSTSPYAAASTKLREPSGAWSGRFASSPALRSSGEVGHRRGFAQMADQGMPRRVSKEFSAYEEQIWLADCCRFTERRDRLESCSGARRLEIPHREA